MGVSSLDEVVCCLLLLCATHLLLQQFFEFQCDGLAGVETTYASSYCRDTATYYCVHASVRDFEAALAGAVRRGR